MATESVVGCRDCTFVLSSVSAVAKITDSSNCTIISAARLFHLSSLSDCKCKIIFTQIHAFLIFCFSFSCNTFTAYSNWKKH